ncbi:MAG: acyl-CoA dehydrogenase [Chloroflexi bacterium RBG_16_48_8]|nr:MAG: acyl-CoA dehydrogenase [Chloroflexi bacterium RBG_16_48_8]
MYSFEPSEEQAMLIDAVKRFATNDLKPVAHDADEEKELSFDLIEKGWELGVLQASIPEEYGGFGEHSAVTGVLAGEELAYGDLAGAMAVMAPGSYVLPLLLGGTEEQKKALLAPVIEAEWKPYVAAFIESRFDFYPGEMDTTAKPNGDSYILNGEKVMVPFADKAEAFLVFANLDGKTQAFIVPPNAEGIIVGDREGLLGIQALPTYRLKINEVKVPKDARVGVEDGFNPELVIASSNVAVAAMAIGVARAAYEYARDYAKERVAFGGPIAQKQSIAFMLAEMAMEIEAHRLLVWEAAWKLDEGKEDAPHAAFIALSGVSEMTMMVTDRAVQILGGYGYIREYPAELWMRNGRGIPTFPGLAFV